VQRVDTVALGLLALLRTPRTVRALRTTESVLAPALGGDVVTASAAAATLPGRAAAMLATLPVVGACAVLVAAVVIPTVLPSRTIALVDPLLQPFEPVQDLFEFLFDAGPAAGIGLRSHPHALRERGADEDEDGECCDSSHFAFVTPDCSRMFRAGGTLTIIGRVKRIDHVGIAVPDLAEARRTWDLVLGQQPECDEVATQKVNAAMYPCGIELVAPTADDSPISKFLAKRGTGIHHVTVEVDDIDAHLARLKAAGVRLINETPTPGHGGCRVAFLHPAATGGVLVELKESK